MKKIITFLLSIVLVFLFAFSPCSVMAQEAVTIDMERLKEICSTLPNEKTVSLAHKDDIITAKKMYDSMDTSQKIELGSENVSKIAVAFEAFTPLLLGDVVTRIEEIPEKVKKANKDEVKTLWEDYNLLPEDARVAVNKKLAKKLNDAVKATNPELLGDEAKDEQEENKNEKEKGKSNFKIWEIVVLSVLAFFILFNIVMVIIVAFKIILAMKKRT